MDRSKTSLAVGVQAGAVDQEYRLSLDVNVLNYVSGGMIIPQDKIPVTMRRKILDLFLNEIKPHVNSIGMTPIEQANGRVAHALKTPGIGVGTSPDEYHVGSHERVIAFPSATFMYADVAMLRPDYSWEKRFILGHEFWLCLHEDMSFVGIFRMVMESSAVGPKEHIYMKKLNDDEVQHLLSQDTCWEGIIIWLRTYISMQVLKKQEALQKLIDARDNISAMARKLVGR